MIDADVYVPKHKFRDLSGQTFGQLTAIKPVGSNGRGHIVWRCNCACGQVRDVSSAMMVRLVKPSCGCVRNYRFIDITGMKSGRLTVVGISHMKARVTFWHCLCACGKTTIIRGDAIRGKLQQSCGCLVRKAGGLAKTPAYGMWWRARDRARKSGLPFSIALDDVVVPEFCPVLGIKLEYGRGAANRDSWASLDRIDNRLGYVPGNVAVISHRANALKRDASLEELLALTAWLSKALPVSKAA